MWTSASLCMCALLVLTLSWQTEMGQEVMIHHLRVSAVINWTWPLLHLQRQHYLSIILEALSLTLPGYNLSYCVLICKSGVMSVGMSFLCLHFYSHLSHVINKKVWLKLKWHMGYCHLACPGNTTFESFFLVCPRIQRS